MTGAPMLQAALDYAKRGLPVFPCDPESKRPLVGNGFKAATAAPDEIERLWRRYPSAMIGVPMGASAGAFVIDIDAGHDKETGELVEVAALVASIEAAIGQPLPPTRTVRTPRGGWHMYFRMPDGLSIGNRAGIVPRVDVRGKGGYVICPPSMRADGATYEWIDPAAPLADAPQALLDLVQRKGAFGKKRAGAPSTQAGAVTDAQRKYALTALDAECRAIRSAGTGSRNTTLHNAAANVAELAAAGAIDPHAALAAIRGAAADNPGNDDDRQLEATIQSGWQKGLAKPRDLSGIAERSPPGRTSARVRAVAANDDRPSKEPSAAGADDVHRRCCQFPCTDYGNAQRLVARFGHLFRWVDTNEVWSRFDGRRWTAEGAEVWIEARVYETVEAIAEEARVMRESGRGDLGEAGGLDYLIETRKDGEEVLASDRLAKWATASQAQAKFSKIKGSARPLAGVMIQPSAFDRNPNLINCLNGTIELSEANGGRAEVRLRPHDPADLITRLMPVHFDPEAICPQYDRFLARVQPEPEMRRFLHQWAGYNLTGHVSEQKLHFWHGGGANGKSTAIDTWAAVLGDYATTMPIESFLDQGRKKTGSDHTADLVKLVGTRMVRTSEPERGSKLAEALVKLVTGNEPIPVREPYAKRGFDLDPAFKLTIGGNHRPTIHGTDDGIWRRMVLVPWDVQIPDEEKDRKLMEKLRAEASGILNRMVEGMIDWRCNGLIEPPSVKAATVRYREDSDPLGRFLALCVREAKGERTQSSKLYALFSAWAVAAGERAWTQMGFSQAMLDRGYIKKQSNTIAWLDIAMTKAPGDFVDADGRALDLDRPSPPPEDDDDMPL